MNRVRLLPEQVANQIAAGEVVERPASVVKELVENSLDAGATRITVEVQAGGRSLVRVTDDGQGMSRDDALMCLERHATSKIRLAEDLASIATMGFRGEALPSIASVSRFILTTRERDNPSPEGTQIIIAGGKMLEVKAAGTAPGSILEVRQLFYNLPARRKFLRSEETEATHIQHYLTLAALAAPEVAFTFLKDGRVVWQLPGITVAPHPAARLAALRERMRALYGDEQKLLPVDFTGDLPTWEDAETVPETVNPASGFRLWGFIGSPGVSRSTRENQHLFVNRRPVENRGLNFALMEGYHTALMKGRYPVCCLFLEIDPAAVDVNIHPAKREVKFHREREVRQLVTEAVRRVLLDFHKGSSVPTPAVIKPPSPTPLENTPALLTHQPALPNLPPQFQPPAPILPARVPPQPVLPMGFGPGGPAKQVPLAPPKEISGVDVDFVEPSPASYAPPSVPMAAPPANPSPAAAVAGPVPLLKVPLRMLGVVGRLYVVFESDRGMVLLDQHAAHERVLFEQMLKRLEQNANAPSQRLLLPETIELSPRDAHFLREQLTTLVRLGVGLSEFGERTFLLDALPPFVRAVNPRAYVLELIDNLKTVGQQVNSLRLGEQVVAKTVCRHAVKANDPLSGRELENLVEDLRRCDMPYTCPHGRPTLLEMNYRELEKKFGRVQ
jgi:DNA mismatch repair protein MutL